MSSSQKKILDNFLDNIRLVTDQIKDGESERNDVGQFDRDKYWEKLGGVYKIVHKECTQLALAYSKPPAPSTADCEQLVTRVQQALLALVSAFFALPKQQGITLRQMTKLSVSALSQAVYELVDAIKSHGMQGSQQQLQCTGNVWSKCDDFVHLPRDNCQAALLHVKQTAGLVTDALEEIEEALLEETESRWRDMDEFLEENGNGPASEEGWTEADRSVISPCLGLIKASKSTIKKLNIAVKKNGVCSSEVNIFQLDDLVAIVEETSPCVDDLVLCLYVPLKLCLVRENAEKLALNLNNLLDLSRHSHVTSEDDASWVDFLSTAVKHNMDNISSITVNCAPDDNT